LSTKVNRQTDITDMFAKLDAQIKRIDGSKTDISAQLNFIEPLTGEEEDFTDSIPGEDIVTGGYRLDSAGGGRAGFYLDAQYSVGSGELDL
jgi:hypothetical protein